MAWVKQTRNRKFVPDGSGGGTLEWDELVARKGFRDQWVHRSIRKEALVAAPEPKEAACATP